MISAASGFASGRYPTPMTRGGDGAAWPIPARPGLQCEARSCIYRLRRTCGPPQSFPEEC